MARRILSQFMGVGATTFLPLFSREYADDVWRMFIGNGNGTFTELFEISNTEVLEGTVVEYIDDDYLVTWYALGVDDIDRSGWYTPSGGVVNGPVISNPSLITDIVKGYIGIRSNWSSLNPPNSEFIDIYDIANPGNPSASFTGLPRLKGPGQLNIARPLLANGWSNFSITVPQVDRAAAIGASINSGLGIHIDASFNVTDLTRTEGGFRFVRYAQPDLWSFNAQVPSAGTNQINVFRESVDLAAGVVSLVSESRGRYTLPSDWQQSGFSDILLDFYVPTGQTIT